ncbi:unnamed protein product [Rhizophagus irregularis]|nr:unnamed protein product [Rhizophagus irregularis]
MNKSTIIFVNENDEAIARAADENYLVNKQVIDEVYLEASRPVMDLQEEMSHKTSDRLVDMMMLILTIAKILLLKSYPKKK